MTSYTSSTIGTSPDDVLLKLNGQEFLVAESWEVHESVFEQPSHFSIRTGSGAVVSQFLTAYQPHNVFQLYVSGALQSTGFVDSIKVTAGPGASEISISGRDALAPLHDSEVRGVSTFNDSTYSSLVWAVLQGVGLVSGSSVDPSQLATTNDANRIVKAGKPVSARPAVQVDQVLEDDSGNVEPLATQIQITAKPGEKWISFLRRYLDPAGLVLWAAANGTFVLSAPNTQQTPLYQLTRRAVNSQAVGNVTNYEFINNCTGRHSTAVVYGRGGGRKNGVSKVVGTQVDPEMQNLGYNQTLVRHETHCQSEESAENYGLRKLAEERREGYQIWYTIAGNTLPLYGTGQGGDPNGQSAVVTVDTIVQVDDEELGISGPFYIDTVVRSRTPHTTTKIRLVRPGDIVLVPTPVTTPATPPAPPTYAQQGSLMVTLGQAGTSEGSDLSPHIPLTFIAVSASGNSGDDDEDGTGFQ